jgi:hypothetical protein
MKLILRAAVLLTASVVALTGLTSCGDDPGGDTLVPSGTWSRSGDGDSSEPTNQPGDPGLRLPYEPYDPPDIPGTDRCGYSGDPLCDRTIHVPAPNFDNYKW